QFTPLQGSSTQTPSSQRSLSAQTSPPHLQCPSEGSQVWPSGQIRPVQGSGTVQRFCRQTSPSEQVEVPHLQTPSVGSQVSFFSQTTPTQRSCAQKGIPSPVTWQTSFDLQTIRESSVPHLQMPSVGSQVVAGSRHLTSSQRSGSFVSSSLHATPRADPRALRAAMASHRCREFIKSILTVSETVKGAPPGSGAPLGKGENGQLDSAERLRLEISVPSRPSIATAKPMPDAGEDPVAEDPQPSSAFFSSVSGASALA